MLIPDCFLSVIPTRITGVKDVKIGIAHLNVPFSGKLHLMIWFCSLSPKLGCLKGILKFT